MKSFVCFLFIAISFFAICAQAGTSDCNDALIDIDYPSCQISRTLEFGYSPSRGASVAYGFYFNQTVATLINYADIYANISGSPSPSISLTIGFWTVTAGGLPDQLLASKTAAYMQDGDSYPQIIFVDSPILLNPGSYIYTFSCNDCSSATRSLVMGAETSCSTYEIESGFDFAPNRYIQKVGSGAWTVNSTFGATPMFSFYGCITNSSSPTPTPSTTSVPTKSASPKPSPKSKYPTIDTSFSSSGASSFNSSAFSSVLSNYTGVDSSKIANAVNENRRDYSVQSVFYTFDDAQIKAISELPNNQAALQAMADSVGANSATATYSAPADNGAASSMSSFLLSLF